MSEPVDPLLAREQLRRAAQLRHGEVVLAERDVRAPDRRADPDLRPRLVPEVRLVPARGAREQGPDEACGSSATSGSVSESVETRNVKSSSAPALEATAASRWWPASSVPRVVPTMPASAASSTSAVAATRRAVARRTNLRSR